MIMTWYMTWSLFSLTSSSLSYILLNFINPNFFIIFVPHFFQFCPTVHAWETCFRRCDSVRFISLTHTQTEGDCSHRSHKYVDRYWDLFTDFSTCTQRREHTHTHTQPREHPSAYTPYGEAAWQLATNTIDPFKWAELSLPRYFISFCRTEWGSLGKSWAICR